MFPPASSITFTWQVYKPGLSWASAHVKLEDRSLALRCIELTCLNQRRFKRFYFAVEEHNAGEQMNGVLYRRGLLFCVLVGGGSGTLSFAGS